MDIYTLNTHRQTGTKYCLCTIFMFHVMISTIVFSVCVLHRLLSYTYLQDTRIPFTLLLLFSHISFHSLELLTCLLIIVILSYIMVTIPLSTMLTQGKWSKYTIVTKPGAVFQICVWLCTYIVFMHLNAAD